MSEEAAVGRNEPCPCGSGKKYKRCHGVAAAPKLGVPKNMPSPDTLAKMQENMNGMDPEMMSQMSNALQRLPRGQMQKLQSIMQKAMRGQDVSKEAEAFEKTLPPDFQAMMSGFKMPDEQALSQMMGQAGIDPTQALAAMGGPALPEPEEGAELTEEQARAIVAAAAAEGKISAEKAQELLKSDSEKKSGFGKFFGKKS